jgi:hypothetical protein
MHSKKGPNWPFLYDINIIMERILRTRHIATKAFGADDSMQPLTAVPRSRYMYFAQFVANSQAATMYPWLTKLGTAEQGVSFKIKNIDKPKVELNAVELNQYNRKRWAYTKVEYQPVTVRMFDTVDNKPLQMWKDYFIYYFGDSRANKSILMNDQVVSGVFNDGTGWGLRPLAEELSFFSRLEIYSLFGRKYTKTTYLNPKITMIDWQQYDSSSSDPDELSITLRYEAIEYSEEQSINRNLETTFGFRLDEPPLEPNNLAGSITAVNTLASRPRIDPGSAINLAIVRNVSTSILGQANSVISQFGLNSSVFNTLQQTINPSAQLVSPATTTFDSGYFQQATSTELAAQNYSNSPNINQNVLGIPNGSLPSATVQIYGSATLGTSPPVSSSLSVYGSFNFGSN